MATRRQETASPGNVQITDDQRITWVKKLLAKRSRKKADVPLFKVFDCLVKLQSSSALLINGKVDRESLTMVVDGAAPDGKFSREEQTIHDSDSRRHQKKHNISEYLRRLKKALEEINPPDYHNPIHLRQEHRSYWLTNLNTSPARQIQNTNKQAFPHWRCWIRGNEAENGPIHLPVPPHRRYEPRLTTVGKWKQPKHFPDYQKFKDACWKEHREKYASAHNGPTLFFAGIEKKAKTLEILAHHGGYSNHIATMHNLPKSVSLPDGTERKISDVLKIGWDSQLNLLPMCVASPVRLDITIITKENTVLVCYDKRYQKWNVSVGTLPHPIKDGHKSNTTEIIKRAICRRAQEELGLFVEPDRISWMAFGVGREKGNTALIGQIKINKTEEEVSHCFENREVHDYVERLEFIPLKVAPMTKFLKTQECRHFLRLALHLCLWRKFPKLVRISAN